MGPWSPYSTAINVVHQCFLNCFETSIVPLICSYCALNVGINVCHISLLDSIGSRLFAKNTMVHIFVRMHLTTMGASNIHRSPIFCFDAITIKYLAINDQQNSSILPFIHYVACVMIFLHIIIKTVPISMSPFEGK